MIFLGMAFFVYILLGFTEVPESLNVYPSLNLRYFQPLFLQRSFSPASLSLSFPSESQVTRKLDLLILPHWPLRLCISLWGFFPHFFLFFSDWIISMGQSSSSLILSFIAYTLLLSFFTILKNVFDIVFFSLKNFNL